MLLLVHSELAKFWHVNQKANECFASYLPFMAEGRRKKKEEVGKRGDHLLESLV